MPLIVDFGSSTVFSQNLLPTYRDCSFRRTAIVLLIFFCNYAFCLNCIGYSIFTVCAVGADYNVFVGSFLSVSRITHEPLMKFCMNIYLDSDNRTKPIDFQGHRSRSQAGLSNFS